MEKETKKRAKAYQRETDITKDANGKVTARKERVLYRSPVNTDRFGFCFLTAIELLLGLGKMEMRVFFGMVPFAKYGTGELALNIRMKKAIAAKTKLSVRSVYHSIDNLVKSGLVMHHGLMDYRINPQHFWVGTQEDRAEVMRELDSAPKNTEGTSLRDFYNDEQNSPT